MEYKAQKRMKKLNLLWYSQIAQMVVAAYKWLDPKGLSIFHVNMQVAGSIPALREFLVS